MNIKIELVKFRKSLDEFHHDWCNLYDNKNHKILSDYDKLVKNFEKERMKDLMLAQLLGFRLGKGGYSISELISSANLTKTEWLDIQNETDITSLDNSDIDEIEKHVNEKSV